VTREKEGLERDRIGLEREKTALQFELRKVYGQRSTLHRQLDHQKGYACCLKGIGELSGKIGKREPVVEHERKRAKELATVNETLLRELAREREGQIRLEEQKKKRKNEAGLWQGLAERLARAEKEFGLSLDSRVEVGHARVEVDREKAELDRLPEFRKQEKALADRVAAHEEAVKKWRHVCRLRETDPESPPRKDLRDDMYEQTITEKRGLEEEHRRLASELVSLRREQDLLSRGRPPLPPHAVELIDKGLARPLADRFEDLDLESATSWQRRLGPLARALEPLGRFSGGDMGGGEDTLWFMTFPEDFVPEPSGERISQKGAWHEPELLESGSFGGHGDMAWFQPEEPIWLSARARFARLGQLKGKIVERTARKECLEKGIKTLTILTAMLFELSEVWEALLDTEASSKRARLEAVIQRLERTRGDIGRKYDLLISLDRDAYIFEYREAPEDLERIRGGLKNAEIRIEDMEKRHQAGITAWNVCREGIMENERILSQWIAERRDFEVRKRGLEKEEPLDVLLGKVDLSKGEEFEKLARDLEGRDERLRARMTNLSERRGALTKELEGLVEAHGRLDAEAKRWSHMETTAKSEWHSLYPDTEPVSRMEPVSGKEVTDAQVRRRQEHGVIMDRISSIVAEHGLAMDLDREPDILVDLLLESLLPSGIDLDREEEQLHLLRNELAGIETKIRGYVEEIRKNVDHELHALSRRIDKVNRILSDLSFGRIRRVRLERTMLPAYEGLKRLRGGQLTLFAAGKPLSLQEFLDQVRDFITRHSRVADIDEDKIADYRTYVHITWSITDEDDTVRRHGFSSGEGLGINLAICLSLLFYLGDATAKDRGEGMLVMALDEAERLDERALATVRSLLDRVKCQLVLALPRTLQVQSSVCHMLTPLEQGVTHVSVYHKG
jgi:chromosome partition protein MukB